MTYTIDLQNTADFTWKAEVDIKNDAGDIVTASEVYVTCATQEEAENAVKFIHLPNMKRNDRALADLVLPLEGDLSAGQA